jgi:hypothetical protein
MSNKSRLAGGEPAKSAGSAEPCGRNVTLGRPAAFADGDSKPEMSTKKST